MTDFATRLNDFILSELPIGFAVFAALCLLLVWVMNQIRPGRYKPLRFSKTGWLNALGWFTVFFSPVLILLFLSVLAMLAQVGWKILSGDTMQGEADNLRWYVLSFVGLLTALGGIIGTPLALIRVWTTERQTKTAEQNHVNEILSKAVENLGAEKTVTRDGVAKTVPSLEVRTGGILALERLARENLDFHIEIMEILTAYIRHNVQSYVQHKSQQENAIRPRDDLVIAFDVLSRRTSDQRAFEKSAQYQLQLNDTTFRRLILAGYNFSGIDFSGSDFTHARLRDLNLEKARLKRCVFNDARLQEVDLNLVDYSHANFSGASFSNMSLSLGDSTSPFSRKAKYAHFHRCLVNLFGDGSKYRTYEAMQFSNCSFSVNSFLHHADDAFKKCAFHDSDLRDTGVSQKQLENASGTKDCKLNADRSIPKHWDDYFLDGHAWRERVERIEGEIPF
nr:pentapeptide repeat-containing protein [uncultured Celeribacter sp.]